MCVQITETQDIENNKKTIAATNDIKQHEPLEDSPRCRPGHSEQSNCISSGGSAATD